MRFLVALLLFIIASPCFAQEASMEHLPVPRWAELAAPEANLRTGPGKRYPIDWILKKRGLPVEIIQEFEHWRRVREPDGADGWVHKSMLASTRRAMLKHSETLYANPASTTRIVAKLQKGVIADIQHCQKEWCELKADQFDGWAEKKNLWGVYKDEVF